jgi:hypothetical protein
MGMPAYLQGRGAGGCAWESLVGTGLGLQRKGVGERMPCQCARRPCRGGPIFLGGMLCKSETALSLYVCLDGEARIYMLGVWVPLCVSRVSCHLALLSGRPTWRERCFGGTEGRVEVVHLIEF